LSANRENQALPLVIVIGGPIASGKSTLARSVAHALERLGLTAATIDLDLVYEMLDHERAPKTDPTRWNRARRLAGAATNAFLRAGLDAVVAEGDLLDEAAREQFVSGLDGGVRVRFVTLTVALTTALVRVEQDQTRGLSRDPVFLTRHYQELAATLRGRPERDLCVATDDVTIGEATESIVRWAFAGGGNGG
jgi:predicted kinase